MPVRDTPVNATKSLHDAASESPVLAKLDALIVQSTLCMKHVLPLVPKELRSAVKAGPFDSENWCLVVNNPTVAAKMKHLLPDMEQLLRQKHSTDIKVRIKVMQL